MRTVRKDTFDNNLEGMSFKRYQDKRSSITYSKIFSDSCVINNNMDTDNITYYNVRNIFDEHFIKFQ